ncbi:MAG: hypothetical protein WCP08_05700 [Prolixibacteraceae bacterium]
MESLRGEMWVARGGAKRSPWKARPIVHRPRQPIESSDWLARTERDKSWQKNKTVKM